MRQATAKSSREVKSPLLAEHFPDAGSSSGLQSTRKMWSYWHSPAKGHRDKVKHRRAPLNIGEDVIILSTGTQPSADGLFTLHHWRYSKATGHSPEQPVLNRPAWAEAWKQMTSRGPCQPQLSCESVWLSLQRKTMSLFIWKMKRSLT